MKQKLISTLVLVGIIFSGVSTVFASTELLAVSSQRPGGSRALNPQPEPPGITGQIQSAPNKLQLNPQPEPPGVTQQNLTVATTTVTTAACMKAAENAKMSAVGAAKIAYNKAVQAATEAKAKNLAYAKTLTDKSTKKAAILKADSDFKAALVKAQKDKNDILASANKTYTGAIAACKNIRGR